MNDKIPTKFLKIKILAEIPRAEFIDTLPPQQLSDPIKRLSFLSMLRKSKVRTEKIILGQTKKFTFNIASWMRIPGSTNQTISLLICYKDEKGEYSLVIDEADISDNFSLMLSGCISFKSIGTPEYIRICISGLNQNQSSFVDDLFVENINAKQISLDMLKTA